MRVQSSGGRRAAVAGVGLLAGVLPWVIAAPAHAAPDGNVTAGALIPANTFAFTANVGGTCSRHVATTGNDANTGESLAAAWRTPAKAVASLQAGEVGCVHAGTYDVGTLAPVNSGTEAQPIALAGAPGEARPVLRGSTDGSLLQFGPRDAYWVVRGLDLDKNRRDGASVQILGNPVSANPADGPAHHIAVTDNLIHDGKSGAAVLVRHAATDVLIQGNKIYGHHRWISGSSVAYSRADASYRRDDANAINLEGTATGQVRRVQIRANDLHDNGGDGIQCLGAHDATGRDDSHDPGDLDAVDNRYHANEEDGADIKSCQRVSVRGSVSPDNAGSAANNKIYHLRPTDKNADLPGNHSGGGAIVVHYYARQVLIENTRIWDTCGGIGIGRADYPPVQNVIIRRNLFFNLVGAAASVGDNKCAGRGIRITSAAHVDMHDNTFDNVPAEAVMLATDNGNDGSVSDDIDVWNNIINNAGTWISLRRHSASVPGGATNVEADRNLFWHPDATANHFILEVTRVDLTAWRAGTGQDQSSLRADPLFVDDPANNDYYVKTEPRSPALDSALNNTGAPFCGAGPDIGFRERCP